MGMMLVKSRGYHKPLPVAAPAIRSVLTLIFWLCSFKRNFIVQVCMHAMRHAPPRLLLW
jgi:hypothetical protein